MKDRVWRDVLRIEEHTEERTSNTSRGFSWSATPVHTVHLSCGHHKIYRGHCAKIPKHRCICRDCEAGNPVLAPPVRHTEPSSKSPRDPVARALLENLFGGPV